MKVLERAITVATARGVHSRVATGLAHIARRHEVRLEIIHGPQRSDASSILDVLSMALVFGTRLTVRIRGKQEQAEVALAEVERILTAEEEP